MDESLIIDWITIHFGKNPKNGGSPIKLYKFMLLFKEKIFE